ncbi:MAG: InlB B-repeat-containing protein [Gaiellaceae bacterium]
MIRRFSPFAATTLIGLVLMLGVPAAGSAAIPDLLTIDTYSTGTTTATVEGILNPENQSTTYAAQYDLESSAWCQTGTGSPAHTTAGTDPIIVENAAQPININLIGLTEGADYCAQLTATNGDGETDGGPVFWRQGAPTVDTNDASPTGNSTATIDGDVNPAGTNTSYAAEYDVVSSTWCTTNGSSGSPAHTTSSLDLGTTDGSVFHDVAVDLTGLSTNTSYCGAIVATNVDGLGEGEQVSWSQPASVTLTVNVSGSGTVTSSPAGINCSTSFCSAPFAQGTQVTLTATPAPGSLFSGWHFFGCTGVGPCTISMNIDQDVVVHFATLPPSGLGSVSVGIMGGSGTVTSAPVTGVPAGIASEINCTSDVAGSITASSTCEVGLPAGTQVTLTASPDIHLGAAFAGWSGGVCAGTSTCSVTVIGGARTSVTANFTQGAPPRCTLKPNPKVALKGPSAGRVSLNIKCDQDLTFSLGANVTVRWHTTDKKNPRRTTTHTWRLTGRRGTATLGTARTLTMQLPKAALARLREKHLSASVVFALNVMNVNGGQTQITRLKLK